MTFVSRYIQEKEKQSSNGTLSNGLLIKLDHAAKTIETFVDLMCTRYEFEMDICLNDYLGLFALCDKFQTSCQAEDITRSLQKRIAEGDFLHLEPWEVFNFAARRDDVQVTRLAVQLLEKGKHRSLSQFIFGASSSFFDDIPPRYVYALFRSALKLHKSVEHPSGELGSVWLSRDWENKDESFYLD